MEEEREVGKREESRREKERKENGERHGQRGCRDWERKKKVEPFFLN